MRRETFVHSLESLTEKLLDMTPLPDGDLPDVHLDASLPLHRSVTELLVSIETESMVVHQPPEDSCVTMDTDSTQMPTVSR